MALMDRPAGWQCGHLPLCKEQGIPQERRLWLYHPYPGFYQERSASFYWNPFSYNKVVCSSHYFCSNIKQEFYSSHTSEAAALTWVLTMFLALRLSITADPRATRDWTVRSVDAQVFNWPVQFKPSSFKGHLYCTLNHKYLGTTVSPHSITPCDWLIIWTPHLRFKSGGEELSPLREYPPCERPF